MDSINKGKIARGFSPLRIRGPELKNSFADASSNEVISTNNTQYNTVLPHSAAAYKQGIPTIEDIES